MILFRSFLLANANVNHVCECYTRLPVYYWRLGNNTMVTAKISLGVLYSDFLFYSFCKVPQFITSSFNYLQISLWYLNVIFLFTLVQFITFWCPSFPSFHFCQFPSRFAAWYMSQFVETTVNDHSLLLMVFIFKNELDTIQQPSRGVQISVRDILQETVDFQCWRLSRLYVNNK